MFYHRGNKLRPEVQAFRLGIQKSQEAIDNSVGGELFVGSYLSVPICRYPFVGSHLSVPICRFRFVGSHLSVPNCRSPIVGSHLSVFICRLLFVGSYLSVHICRFLFVCSYLSVPICLHLSSRWKRCAFCYKQNVLVVVRSVLLSNA